MRQMNYANIYIIYSTINLERKSPLATLQILNIYFTVDCEVF